MLSPIRTGCRLALASMAFATATVAQTFVMTTNATTHTLVAFSPVDGSLVDASVFVLPNTTQVAAIDVNDEIWISEPTNDRIERYDISGVVLAAIYPTFPGGGLDDVRGMTFVNGLVHVTNAGAANGAPGSAVVVFDPFGAYQYSFSTQSLATSPASVMPLQGSLLVAGAANADDVHRFSMSGADLGTFHDSASVDGAAGDPTSAGTSALPLPIPNAPTLSGAGFFTQGAALTTATPFGLATSNGLWLVLGT